MEWSRCLTWELRASKTLGGRRTALTTLSNSLYNHIRCTKDPPDLYLARLDSHDCLVMMCDTLNTIFERVAFPELVRSISQKPTSPERALGTWRIDRQSLFPDDRPHHNGLHSCSLHTCQPRAIYEHKKGESLPIADQSVDPMIVGREAPQLHLFSVFDLLCIAVSPFKRNFRI